MDKLSLNIHKLEPPNEPFQRLELVVGFGIRNDVVCQSGVNRTYICLQLTKYQLAGRLHKVEIILLRSRNVPRMEENRPCGPLASRLK